MILLCLFMGAALGNFIATIVVRYFDGRSWWRGRSACDHCSAAIPFHLCTPIISYIYLQGRCRACGGRIAFLHLGAEILAVGATFWAIFAVNRLPDPVWYCALAALLFVISVVDIHTMRIPNGANVAVLMISAVIAACEGRIVDGVAAGLVCAMLLLTFQYLFQRIRGSSGLGLGDVKLFAGLAVALGVERVGLALAAAALLALPSGLLIASKRNDKRIPFGPFLASGALMAFCIPLGI